MYIFIFVKNNINLVVNLSQQSNLVIEENVNICKPHICKVNLNFQRVTG